MSCYQDEQHFFLKPICHVQDLHGTSFVEFIITTKVITCAFETKKYNYHNKISHKVVEIRDENLYQNRGLMTMKIWDEMFYYSKIGENLNLDLKFISM
jgi:hypothetical protein